MAPTSSHAHDGGDNGGLEPWEQKTDELFRTKTVEEIKTAQRSNRDAIEKKKTELRELVTDRYRDLIEAADTVVTMASSAAEVVSSAHNMQELCQNIQHGSRQFGEADYDRAAPSAFYTIAIQMKLLMDAPEQIWSALEERNFFRAAIMYVTSKFIFDGVRNERDSTNRRLLKSFPILFRQWDSIQPFKENITRTAREFFLSPQPDDAAVAALAAVMVVDQLSVTAALQWYLDVKSESVSAALTAVPLGQGLAVEPTEKVCAVVQGIAQTVRQLHTLFGQSGAADDDDDDDADAGDAGLGKVGRFLRRAVSANRAEDGGAAGGLFLSQAMPASVRDFRPPLATGALDKIPADTLQATCGGWFRGLIPTVEEGAGRVLRQVEAVVGVVTVRDAIWTLLGQEYATLAPGITVSVADDAGPWGVLCRRVLGKETELWGTLLQQSVMHRAQTVLTSMFRVAVEAAFSTATTYTAAIAAGEVEVAEESNVGENLWGHRKAPEGGHATQQQQQPQQQHAKGDDAGALAAAVGLASCPPSVRQVVEGLTVALANVLEQSRVLLEEARDTTPRGLSDPPPPFEKCGDAIELRRFLQAACEKCVDDFVANVDTEVAAILSKEGGAANAGANAVDQILFLGRVCRAVVLHANEVQQLMLLPAGGKGGHLDGKFVARTRRAAQRRAAPTEHDTRLAAVRDKLLAACGRCHAVWTSRISHDRAVEFRRRLLEHDWAGVVVEKRTWQRHTVEEETEAGGKLESVVRLPSQASSYVLTLLCNACAEVSRVGGHTVETETIGALADALYDECVVGYTELLNGPTRKALSQDALLQILFDLYFVGDVLLGSAPPAAGGPGQRHVHFGDLVNQCKEGVDPFDLVIFLPLLEASRTKMYHRCTTLLGYFTQLRPAPSGLRPTLSSSEQSNTMALADVVNRFPLLPISAGGGLKPGIRGAKPKKAGQSAALFAL